MDRRNPKSNSEGYSDPTVFCAMISNDHEKDIERAAKVLKTIVYICDLAGFRIQGKIALRNKNTGKVFMKD